MNYNNNSQELTNYPWYLDIPTHQHYYSFSSNQGHITQEQQYQQEKEKQKSRGNRKLQRYRRKLRKQGMNADAIARSIEEWVNIDSSKSNQIEQQKKDTTTSLINVPVLHLRTIVAKKHKKNKQRSTILKTKRNINRSQNMDQMQLSSTTTESA
jgi:phosphoenolpyruvate synthase/pyruvate phosphate dikinase